MVCVLGWRAGIPGAYCLFTDSPSHYLLWAGRFPPQYNAGRKVILFAPPAASRRGREHATAQMHQSALLSKGQDTSTHSLMARMQSVGHIRPRKEGKVVDLSGLCLQG